MWRLEMPQDTRDPFSFSSVDSILSLLSSGSGSLLTAQEPSPAQYRTSTPINIPVRFVEEYHPNHVIQFPPPVRIPVDPIELFVGEFPAPESPVRRAQSLPLIGQREDFIGPITNHPTENENEVENQNDQNEITQSTKLDESDFFFAILLSLLIGTLIYILTKTA